MVERALGREKHYVTMLREQHKVGRHLEFAARAKHCLVRPFERVPT